MAANKKPFTVKHGLDVAVGGDITAATSTASLSGLSATPGTNLSVFAPLSSNSNMTGASGTFTTLISAQGDTKHDVRDLIQSVAAGVTVKEADGAPNATGVTTIVVSNGTLTDDGSNQVTIQTGGGSGGSSFDSSELAANSGNWDKTYSTVYSNSSTWGTNTTYTAGSGLELYGTEFSHENTSSQNSVDNSGNNFIQDLTLDAFGHITAITSAEASDTIQDLSEVSSNSGDWDKTYSTVYSNSGTFWSAVTGVSGGIALVKGTAHLADPETLTQIAEADAVGADKILIWDESVSSWKYITVEDLQDEIDTNSNTTYTAGSGLELYGTEFSHENTSSQNSVDNSGNNFIQDITLDAFGHITNLVTAEASDTIQDLSEVSSNSGNWDKTYSTVYSNSGTFWSAVTGVSGGIALVEGTAHLADPETLTQIAEADAVAGDRMLIWDESESSWKYITVEDLQDEIDTTGGGGSGTVNTGSDGKLAYYDGAGTAVNDTVTLNYNDSTHSLGIGKSDPDEILHVYGIDKNILLENQQAGTLAYKLKSTARTWHVGADNSPDIFYIRDEGNTSNRLIIDSDGNLGIGSNLATDIINERLTVVGNITAGGNLSANDISVFGDISASGGITLADGAIARAYIADDAINGDKIADDAVNSEHYTDGSIDTDHIADNQVTLAKMAGLARGSIIHGNASGDPTALAKGSANTVLQSDGTDISYGTVTNDMLAGSIANAKLANSAVTVTAGDGLKTGGSVSLGGSVTLDVDVSDFAGTGIDADGSENLNIAAAQTSITSILATDVKIGEDDETKVDFGTPNEIHFYADDDKRASVTAAGLSARTDLLISGDLSGNGILSIGDGTIAANLSGNLQTTGSIGIGTSDAGIAAQAPIHVYASNDYMAVFNSTDLYSIISFADNNTTSTATTWVGAYKDEFQIAVENGSAKLTVTELGLSARNDFVTTGTAFISGDVQATGTAYISGDMQIGNDIVIKGNNTSINGVNYTWPSSDGSAGQQLQTNGSGTLSWEAAGSGGGGGGSMDNFTLAGDGGSNQTIGDGNTLTVAGGNGITTTGAATDTVSIAVDAAQTTITSLLATDIKIGEDDQTKVDFGTPNEIHFYADDDKRVSINSTSLSARGDLVTSSQLSGSGVFTAGNGTVAASLSGAIQVTGMTSLSSDLRIEGNVTKGTWQGTPIAQAYIADDAINGDKIADDAVNSEHYTDGSIDTDHIADNQVTLAKMAGLARGSIIHGNASGDPTALAKGSANTVLQSDGTDISYGTVSNDMLAGSIANAKLANSAVTVTAGDGLKTGGSVSLGGSVTLDIDVSDFAGTGIDADGSENLNIAAAQTSITSILATDIKIGEDDETKVDFGTPNEIHFYADDDKRVSITSTGLSARGDSVISGQLSGNNVFTAGNGTVAASLSGNVQVTGMTSLSSDLRIEGNVSKGTWQGTPIARAYIADDAINGDKIADDAVNSEHYTDGSIDTDHIADNQVTLAKMAGLARGSIIHGNASGDPTALAKGSANTVLQSDGTDISYGTVSNDMLAGSIANAKLANSAVTVTAGDGLKTGGSVSLGGSVTLDIDVSDFAGTGIDADGSENLNIAAAQTSITSILATDVKIGEDDETKIDFGTPNEIHFYADDDKRASVTSAGLSAQGDLVTTGQLSAKGILSVGDGTIAANLSGNLQTTGSIGIGTSDAGIAAQAPIHVYASNDYMAIFNSTDQYSIISFADNNTTSTTSTWAGAYKDEFQIAVKDGVANLTVTELGLSARNDFVTTGTAFISGDVQATGTAFISGDMQIGNDIVIKGNNTSINGVNYTWPSSDGSAGQQLQTNGSGTLSWEAAGSGGGSGMTNWILEDGDGTEVTVSDGKEVKFIEGGGIDIDWTDTSNGTDGDPYDLTFTIDAAQTGITSLLATDIKIGEDDETKIDFEEANEVHVYADNDYVLNVTTTELSSKGIFTAGNGTIAANLSGNIRTTGFMGFGRVPGVPLDLLGDFDFGMRIESTDPYAIIAYADNSTSGNISLYSGAVGNSFIVATESAERLRVNSSGVGVHTTKTPASLTVNGDVSATNGYKTGVKDLGTHTTNGEVAFDIDGPSLQRVVLKANMTTTYLGVESLQNHGNSITVELSACGANRNLAFDNAMLFIGEKPTVLASGKVALLSITTFGPLCANASETDVRCAYGVQD